MAFLIYFEYNSAAGKSVEQMLKDHTVIGTAYLVDEITGDEWGDDWNDAPADMNAGPPYKQTCKGLRIVEVKIGEPFPT